MKKAAEDALRDRLMEMLETSDQEDDRSQADRAIVTLDQQAVGRLSRMDALQRQAMAEAQKRRRAQQRQRVQAALARLNEGEFGFCTDCGEAIEPARLDLDPTVPRCLSCTQG